MHSTNYYDTFIEVAEDCPATTGEAPPVRAGTPTVARLQYEILIDDPYGLTSDDLIFEVHAKRKGIPEAHRDEERAKFFSRGRACLRSSPLTKRYGWGVHSDGEGRVAIYPLGSEAYERLADEPDVEHRQAMRSRRK